MQASATTLLCEEEQQRDFYRAIAARASIIFGPVSGHRSTQELVASRCESRTTRLSLAERSIRVLCNGVCTSLAISQTK